MRFIFGTLFIFTLVMWGLWILQRDEGVATRGPVTASAPAVGPGDLRMDLWVDRNRVAPTEPVPFSLTIQNPNATEVSNLNLEKFSDDGFQEAGDCWSESKPSCTKAGQAVIHGGLPSVLPAGGSVQIVATLRAAKNGRSAIGGLVSWRGALGSRTKLIVSSPITIEPEYSAFGRATRSFVKDVGWPIALAIIGYFFKIAEGIQTRLRETWNVMFQLSHDRAEKYWMPLAATLKWMQIAHEKSPRDQAFAFFFLLRLWRQMVDVSREIGGFFLKTHVTEEMLSSCWSVILIWSMKAFGTKREEAALTLSSSVMSYPDFQDRYASRHLFAALARSYSAQSENALDLVVTLAAVMEQVLDYEMNRPYAPWYEDPVTPFDVARFDQNVAKLTRSQEYLATHSLLPFPEAEMGPLRETLNEAMAEIQRYRAFVVRDRRYLQKLLAV